MKKLALRFNQPWLLTYGVLTALFFYTLAVLHGFFLNGKFAYHDVTLTNDFLGSYVYDRGFFWISDSGGTHFKVHFTPTLALLGPFYRLWDSQFLLMTLSTVALFTAIWCALEVFRTMTATTFKETWDRQPALLKSLLPVALVAVMALNLYTKSVVLAANAWMFYLPCLTLTVLLLVRNASLWALIPAALLALGVRQDAGFYFVFQIAALWFFPVRDAQLRKQLRRNIVLLVALALIYVGLAVFAVMPALGAFTHIDRGWGQYGNSWAEIATNFLTSPSLLLDVFKNSAFRDLNGHFFWLAVFSPWSFLLNNLPGALLYACNDSTKRFLDFYNANYLLPGLFIATVWGSLSLLSLRLVKRFHWLSYVLCIGLVCILWRETEQLNALTKSGGSYLLPGQSETTYPFRHRLDQALEECPAINKIAADFKNIVFVPNFAGKYLPQHFRDADAVFLQMGTGITQPGWPTSEQTAATIDQEGAFDLKSDQDHVRYYLRKGFQCAGTAG